MKVMTAIEIEKEDSILMTKEDFFDRLDKAEKEIAEGKGVTFTNKDDMNALTWVKTCTLGDHFPGSAEGFFVPFSVTLPNKNDEQ